MTFVCFLPALQCKFVNFDDPYYVTDNPWVSGGLSAAGTRCGLCNVLHRKLASVDLAVAAAGRDTAEAAGTENWMLAVSTSPTCCFTRPTRHCFFWR